MPCRRPPRCSPPSRPFWEQARSGPSLGATIGIALLALALAAVAGVVIGLLVGQFRVRHGTPPWPCWNSSSQSRRSSSSPSRCWSSAPQLRCRLFLVVFGCLLPIVMQTVDGVQGTDPVARDTARSYGMGEGEILARVVLPSAMPYIGTAMRVAAPAALVVTVVAGLLGGRSGPRPKHLPSPSGG